MPSRSAPGSGDASRRSLFWFRRDLRLRDHPALRAAVDASALGGTTLLFVLDPELWQRAGAARRAWLAGSLDRLRDDLGGRLTIRVGSPADVVPDVARQVGAGSVHATADTTPYAVRRDEAVAVRLAAAGVAWRPADTPYALAPGTVRNQQGNGYHVFTPFARRWRELVRDSHEPLRAPPAAAFRDGEVEPRARQLLEAALAAPGPTLPTPGERAATRHWRSFLARRLAGYAADRDRPDLDATSRLSPYLHLGVVHPRTLLANLTDHRGAGPDTFLDELAWREFYADVLWHRPGSAWRDLRPTLHALAYDDAGDVADAVEAWRRGATGFPIVDAGMRQLLAQGWMHNRVRMITASFLTKDLHVWWPHGARYFLDHLIDGDLASNNHGWQWVAGTGTDAAPYFRVFNPVVQGRRFDPDGGYVRRWVPELAHLPGATVHEPWRHPEGDRHHYPARIVDHAAERREALSRYEVARRSG